MKHGKLLRKFSKKVVTLLCIFFLFSSSLYVTVDFSGKAKAIGVSNYTKTHLEELLKICEIRPSVNQVH
jgi:hypothetical protein